MREGKHVVVRLVCSANTHQRLNEAGQAIFNDVKQEPQLILVILPQAAAELRLQVKNWGDVDKGVATQCVVSVLPPSTVWFTIFTT